VKRVATPRVLAAAAWCPATPALDAPRAARGKNVEQRSIGHVASHPEVAATAHDERRHGEDSRLHRVERYLRQVPDRQPDVALDVPAKELIELVEGMTTALGLVDDVQGQLDFRRRRR